MKNFIEIHGRSLYVDGVSVREFLKVLHANKLHDFADMIERKVGTHKPSEFKNSKTDIFKWDVLKELFSERITRLHHGEEKCDLAMEIVNFNSKKKEQLLLAQNKRANKALTGGNRKVQTTTGFTMLTPKDFINKVHYAGGDTAVKQLYRRLHWLSQENTGMEYKSAFFKSQYEYFVMALGEQEIINTCVKYLRAKKAI